MMPTAAGRLERLRTRPLDFAKLATDARDEVATTVHDPEEVWKHHLFCEAHTLYTVWSVWMMIVTTYAVVYDPYELAFLESDTDENWRIDMAITTCFFCVNPRDSNAREKARRGHLLLPR